MRPRPEKQNGRGRDTVAHGRDAIAQLLLHNQKPSEKGRSIPIFDGEPRNTEHAFGGKACADHILLRHVVASEGHARTYRRMLDVHLSG
jgi:hypothetical protein